MLNFIGTGSAFNTRLGNNSAYRKMEDHLFLIDCGGSVFGRLVDHGVLSGVNHITVLITHLHPDHVGSLGDLIFYSLFKIPPLYQLKTTVLIPTPLEKDLEMILDLMGVTKDLYTLTEMTGSYETNVCGIASISPHPVGHIDRLSAYGYILQIGKKKLYYSGDSNEIPDIILEKLLSGDLNYLYQDTCMADYEGNPHLPLRKLGQIIPPNDRNKVYCMHLDEEFAIEEAKSLGFHCVFANFNSNDAGRNV